MAVSICFSARKIDYRVRDAEWQAPQTCSSPSAERLLSLSLPSVVVGGKDGGRDSRSPFPRIGHGVTVVFNTLTAASDGNRNYHPNAVWLAYVLAHDSTVDQDTDDICKRYRAV